MMRNRQSSAGHYEEDEAAQKVLKVSHGFSSIGFCVGRRGGGRVGRPAKVLGAGAVVTFEGDVHVGQYREIESSPYLTPSDIICDRKGTFWSRMSF